MVIVPIIFNLCQMFPFIHLQNQKMFTSYPIYPLLFYNNVSWRVSQTHKIPTKCLFSVCICFQVCMCSSVGRNTLKIDLHVWFYYFSFLQYFITLARMVT